VGFDAPNAPGNIAERHEFLKSLHLDALSPHLSLTPLERCTSQAHLKQRLKEVVNKSGEGLMLHDPSSPYTPGRVSSLLKVKCYLEDDVKLIGKSPNSYSFTCLQKSGAISIVKCTGSEYLHPPEAGTVMTVRHTGYQKKSGKLKYPFLYRIRYDLNWEDIMNDR